MRPVAAVILAAGGSARMGRAKQLLPIDGQPMIRHVTEIVCAAGLAQVIVVVGAQAGAVERAVAGLPVEVVVNDEWATGMSSSLRAGLRVLRSEIQAVVLVLGDQPAMTVELIELLVGRYLKTRAALVAPIYHGQRGTPVLFDRSLFPELLSVVGDQGGRSVVARHWREMEAVEIDDRAVMLDIDTQQDYEEYHGGR